MNATFLSQIPVAKKLLLLVLIPCLLQAFFVCVLAGFIFSAQKDLQRIEHQRDALVALKTTAGVAVTGLMRIQDRRSFGEDDARREIARLNEAFRSETGNLEGLDEENFPELKEIIEDARSMQGQMETLLIQAQKNINTTVRGRKIKRNRLVERTMLIATILNFQSIAKRIVAAEASFKASDVERVGEIQKSLNTAIFVVLGINALITVAFVYLFTKDVAGRLKIVSDNTHKLAQQDKELVPCPGSDEIAAIDAALRDVAAELEQQRRQQLAILDNAVDVVFTLDDKLKLSAVNNASRESWGVAPDELLGRNFLSLLTPEYRETVGDGIKVLMSGRDNAEKLVAADNSANLAKSEKPLEAAILLPNSEVRTFEITLSRQSDSPGLTGVARDVTQERAVAALKERLLAIVSHDLRTPLASLSITLSVQVEGKRIADPSLNKQLTAIDLEVQKVMDLTHQLLKMEKQESELAAIAFDSVKAYNVWLQLKSTISPICRARGISLVGPGNDAEIYGNEDKLVEAATLVAKTILNLCDDDSVLKFEIDSGASDFSRASIRISTDKLSPAPEIVSTGALLERLRNVHDENIFDSENLALSSARAIIARHDGEMIFDLHDSSGLAVTLFLPVAEGVC